MRASRTGTTTRVAVFAFVVALAGIGLAELQHRELRLAFDAQTAELDGARGELQSARTALLHADEAFGSLLGSHEELRALHQDSMDWGPLRGPRDCVREVILMDQTAWPVDRDGELAHCISAYLWSEGERAGLVEDLNQCFQFAFPRVRPERDDSRAGDADSSWIAWPEGYVVEPFAGHEKKGGRDR